MVGPVLLKQDKTEAVMAVDARLDFIENEMYGSLSNEIEGIAD
jgi:chaperonin cofactor prefoldin